MRRRRQPMTPRLSKHVERTLLCSLSWPEELFSRLTSPRGPKHWARASEGSGLVRVLDAFMFSVGSSAERQHCRVKGTGGKLGAIICYMILIVLLIHGLLVLFLGCECVWARAHSHLPPLLRQK